MKERGIVIIGSGISSPLMSKIMENIHSETIVVDAKTTDQSLMPFVQEPFVLSNPYSIQSVGGQRKFICKGKHQYIKDTNSESKLNGNWVCQCGRVLGT